MTTTRTEGCGPGGRRAGAASTRASTLTTTSLTTAAATAAASVGTPSPVSSQGNLGSSLAAAKRKRSVPQKAVKKDDDADI